MKRFVLLVLLLGTYCCNVKADSWLAKKNFAGTKREQVCGFSIGLKGYFGMGIDSLNHCNDFWEYDQTNDTWTQKAPFPGTPRGGGVAFAINGKGYMGTGYDGTVFASDFYEYNPGNNTWTQKTDYPVNGGIQGAVAFVIGNKGYVGTGYNTANGNHNDFWEFDPVADTWTAKTNYGGTARNSCAGFAIGTKGYICCGYNGVYNKDVWEFDSQANTWTKKADLGGSGRTTPVGFTIGSRGYVAIGFDLTTGYKKDLWQYNPGNDSWTQKADYPGNGDGHAAGFVIGNKAYVGTGHENVYFKDFYEYSSDSIITSIKGRAEVSNAFIFPNPSNGNIHVYHNLHSSSKAQLTLFDITGKQISSAELETQNSTADFNFSELPNGIYFYVISADSKNISNGRLMITK